MKLSMVLLFLLPVIASAAASPDDIEFRGILDLGDSRVFSLSTDAEDGPGTAWVAEGESFAGYEIVEFRSGEQALILHRDGEEYSLSLGSEGVVRGEINPRDISNLRQIAQAALIYAHENDDKLPGGETVETVHDVARLLAREAGLTHASMWVSQGDARSGSEESLTTVLDEEGSSLDSVFEGQDVVAFDFATGLDTEMPSTTPVAWSRGLKEDGTWDERGTFGSSGGIIVFLGGNVATYYENLGGEGEEVLVSTDGARTSNILEALPAEARVVGSGPGSLHGSIGVDED